MLRYRYLQGSISKVNAHVAGPTATAIDGGCALEGTRSLLGMYNDSTRKVRLSRLSMGEGDSHSNDAGNVTPASDVS